MFHLEKPLISSDVRERASHIEIVLMDVDGVLTDGRLFYLGNQNGGADEFKAFNSHDGLGLHFLTFSGIKTGVISGRKSAATEERARILNMSYVYQGFLDKAASYEEILSKEQITQDKVAFVGDDFIDVPLMLRSGLGCAVADARTEVRQAAHYVTSANGGQGAVREICELILRSRGLWNTILSKYGLPEEPKQ